LEEFPPRAGGFDGDEWYIEGHGTFKACTSNYHETTDYYPGRAFTKSLVQNFGFATLSDGTVARWSGNNGLPNQSSSDLVGTFQGHQGDWLELELPYRIRVKSFQIQTRLAVNSPGDHPKNGFLYGSNNRENWTQVTEFTNLSYTPSQLDGIGGQKAIWNIDSETGFKYLRLLTTQKIDGSDAWLMISELKYFGTREQGQSVLHDGQLTLTKSLNVPRIGPALDADDTPRRDRLVVEYNTSTNPTFEGAVRDTSGRGNDGAFYGTNMNYSSTEKAFEFNGTDDYIFTGNVGNRAGAWIHSYSMWINLDDYTNENIVLIGQDASSNKASSLKVNNSTDIQWFFFGSDVTFTHSMALGAWYHIAAVYDGGAPDSSRRLWINGTESTISGAGAGTALNLSANAEMRIGRRQYDTTTNHFNGSISNFKLYDTALTAEEVKTLYDMGRNGSVANPQPLHIAAPLYSPGTTVQLVHKHAHDYHTVNSNYGRITPMTLSIKPKFSNSKILVQMMVNGEGHQDATFRVLRYIDGTFTAHMPPDAFQTPAASDGIAPVTWDDNLQSTMGSVHITFVDSPNTTGVVEYQLYYKVQNNSTVYRFSLNQTHRDSTGNYPADEHSVSSIVLQEIAQ
jgi:hypothetical protein